MKIFQFTTGMSDGGAETLIVNYANLLKEYGYIPIILTIYRVNNSANSRRIRENGIQEISIFNKHNYINRIFRVLLGKWYIPFELKRIIEREKPDCIHAHMQVLEYIAEISSKLKGIRLFYTCHSVPDRYLAVGSKENISARKLIEKCNLQIIGLHDEMRKRLNQILEINNTVVVKNGIDFNKYNFNLNVRNEIRDELGINDYFVIGHVGRFIEVKNHFFILEIFDSVLKIKKNAKLLLIGSGSLEIKIREKIKKMGIEKNVIILSHRTDIPKLLMGMDAFVFPSFYEGLSLTLIEAQKIGLRCIISDSINKDNVMSNNTFMLGLNESPKKWAELILGVNVNPAYDGLDRLREYDLNVVIDQLITLYGENEFRNKGA